MFPSVLFCDAQFFFICPNSKKEKSYQVKNIKMAKAKELSRIPQLFFSKYIPKKFPTNKNKFLGDLLSKPPKFFLTSQNLLIFI